MNLLLIDLLKLSLYIFLIGLTLVTGYQLISGAINTRGLLRDKLTGKFSSGRLQLLVVTIFGGLFYLYRVIQTPEWQEIPQELLMTLGGSSAVYLGAKSVSLIRSIAGIPRYLKPFKH